MIPVTALHGEYLFAQAWQGLLQAQSSMRSNAQAHVQMALSQTTPVGELATMIDNAAGSYLRTLQSVSDRLPDPTLQAAITRNGLVVDDLNALIDPLRVVATDLQAASKASYTEIIAACNSVIDAVEAVPSVWE